MTCLLKSGSRACEPGCGQETQSDSVHSLTSLATLNAAPYSVQLLTCT